MGRCAGPHGRRPATVESQQAPKVGAHHAVAWAVGRTGWRGREGERRSMATPSKFRSRLATLEIVLLVAGLAAWAALPILSSTSRGGDAADRLFILVPVGWMLIVGSVATMAFRFAHWGVERVRAAKDRIGIK